MGKILWHICDKHWYISESSNCNSIYKPPLQKWRKQSLTIDSDNKCQLTPSPGILRCCINCTITAKVYVQWRSQTFGETLNSFMKSCYQFSCCFHCEIRRKVSHSWTNKTECRKIQLLLPPRQSSLPCIHSIHGGSMVSQFVRFHRSFICLSVATITSSGKNNNNKTNLLLFHQVVVLDAPFVRQIDLRTLLCQSLYAF